MRGFIIYICLGLTGSLLGQVGINTTNPQEALHIAGSTGTLRVEGLNSVNNAFNGGDVNGDTDLSNDTFPLYVDDEGNFTLELKTLEGSEDLDAFDDTALPNSTIYLPASNNTGSQKKLITSYSVTVNRAALLEVKYIISFDVYLDTTKALITDNLARRIQNFLQVTGQTRSYGRSNKCYTNGTSSGVAETMYNSNTAYITLPAAGTYDVELYGAVVSDVKGGGGGTTSKSIYVEFATGNDFIFMRLH